MSAQPESTERCPVCLRAKWRVGSDHPDACEREQENATVLDKFECYYVGYERVSRALAEAEKERDEARNRNGEYADGFASAQAYAASADERCDQLGELLTKEQRDFAAYKETAEELHRASIAQYARLIAAEERAAQAERRLFENGHAILAGDASCCDACDRAVLSRDEPRAAAPKALDSKALNVGGGAQGEEK